MTKQLYKSLIKAAKEGNLFDWLYSESYQLDKDELSLVARELAYALQQPDRPDSEFRRGTLVGTFIYHMNDFYDTYGFEPDPVHDGEDE